MLRNCYALKMGKTDFEGPTLSGKRAENNLLASKDQPSQYFSAEVFDKRLVGERREIFKNIYLYTHCSTKKMNALFTRVT